MALDWSQCAAVESVAGRLNGAWVFRDFAGMDAVCHLSSLDCSLPLAQVYKNVPFTGPGSDEAFGE